MEKESRRKKSIKRIRGASAAIEEKTITLILGAFGLVTALAWNEAIKSLFETLFQKRGTLIGKFTYAAITTVVVVLVSLRLKKISHRYKK